MQYYDTPLHKAKDGAVAKALIEAKAEINVKNKVMRRYRAKPGDMMCRSAARVYDSSACVWWGMHFG